MDGPVERDENVPSPNQQAIASCDPHIRIGIAPPPFFDLLSIAGRLLHPFLRPWMFADATTVRASTATTIGRACRMEGQDAQAFIGIIQSKIKDRTRTSGLTRKTGSGYRICHVVASLENAHAMVLLVAGLYM